jgi:hypothetical protein
MLGIAAVSGAIAVIAIVGLSIKRWWDQRNQ